MKVFYFYNIYGPVDNDIMDGLRNMGAQVAIHEVDPFTKNTLSSKQLAEISTAIKEFGPDFILATHDFALEPNGKLYDLYKKMGLSLACWFVDEPALALFADPWLSMFRSGLIKIFMIDRQYVRLAKEAGISYVWHLPLGTNLNRFRRLDLTDIDREQYKANVVFVGRLGIIALEQALKRILAKRPEDPQLLAKIVDETCKLYLADNGTPMLTHLHNIIRNLHPDPKALVDEINRKNMIQDIFSFIEHGTSLKLRKDLVAPMSRFGLKVYGEPEWKRYLPDDCVFIPQVKKIRNSGLAVPYYGDEIVKIYQASKININVTKLMLKTAVNQRVFDVPACGGFLLTDYRGDLETLFQLDKEMVCYRGLDDLKQKVRYFLENPCERNDISVAGQRRVRADHGYEHRLAFIYDNMH